MSISKCSTNERASKAALTMQAYYARRIADGLNQKLAQLEIRLTRGEVVCSRVANDLRAVREKYRELDDQCSAMAARAWDDDASEHERATWKKKLDKWNERNLADYFQAEKEVARLSAKLRQLLENQVELMEIHWDTMEKAEKADARYRELCNMTDDISEADNAQSV